jgi:hypothetical protein
MPGSIGRTIVRVVFASVIPCALIVAQDPGRPTPPALGCDEAHLAPFEFWVGTWEAVATDGTVVGHDSVTVVLGGCALHEVWHADGGHSGRSYTTFHRSSGRWYQTWVDNVGTFLHLEGGPVDSRAIVLAGSIVGRDGQPLRSRITWTPCRPDCGLRQRWEVSGDSGTTWLLVSDLRFRSVH